MSQTKLRAGAAVTPDPISPPPARFLTTVKVAERYGVATRTVERWAAGIDDTGRRATLPSPLHWRNRKFWAEEALVAWERAVVKTAATGCGPKVRATIPVSPTP